MIFKVITSYLLNCFILVIPVCIWNIIFMTSLPKGYSSNFFWKNIPPIIGTMENILRIIVFIFPLLMPLSLETNTQKIGFIIYIVGVIIYFLSWIMQIYYTESAWSKSVFGFLAPAYTTIIWLVGIGLTGNKLFFNVNYNSVIYVIIALLFVVFHTSRVFIVYSRL